MSFFSWIRRNWNRIPVVIEQKNISRLRKRHKELTRTISHRASYGPYHPALEKEELQQVDDLIVHSISIQFNRLLWFFILPALIIAIIFLCLWESKEVPVFINIRATRVNWTVANAGPGKNNKMPWHMQGNDHEIFSTEPVHWEDQTDTIEQNLVLKSCGADMPVEIEQLSVPDKCEMTLNFPDSLQAEILYNWTDTVLPPPLVAWDLAVWNRKSMGSEDCRDRKYAITKQLKRGDLHSISLEGPHHWQMPMPVRVHEVNFKLANWDEETRSAVLSGKVKILNVSDSAIVLNRGDWLKVRFKDPVDLYLSTESGVISVQTSGIADSISCGPLALGNEMNRMPKKLKTLTDESPYLLTLLAIVIPLLMTMVIRQRKSI